MPSRTHEDLIKVFRRSMRYRGYRDCRTPMPTFRPDLFGEKVRGRSKLVGQVAVEAEIRKTLFSAHTEHQLLMMDEFLRIQHAKRIRAHGFLILPTGKDMKIEADMRLFSLFPQGTRIQYLQFSV